MDKMFPVEGMQLLAYSVGPKNRTIIFRNHFKMEDDVDPELLKEAVRIVREYFWLLRVSLVVHKGSLMHEEIQNEPPVFHRENKSYTLGTEDTNGYMYYFLYEDNEIDFFFCHGLSDPTALGLCTTFILKVYSSLKYPEHAGFDVDSEYKKLNIWETHDPFEEFSGEKISKINFDPHRGFTIPTGSEYSVYDVINIDIPLEQTLKVVKDMGATPVTFLTALFDRAIRDCCAVGDSPIVSSVTMDLRKLTGKFPLTGYTGTALMKYLPEYDRLDIKELCRRFREDLDSQKDIDIQNLMINMSRYMTKVMSLKLLPLELKFNMLSSLIGQGEKVMTYASTNVGKVPLPDEKVVSLEVFATGITQTNVSITSTGDTMNIKFLYYLHDKKILNRFMDLLRNEGLEPEYYVKSYSEPTYFDISKLRRV